MADPLKSFSPLVTPQSEPAAPNQVRNSAGGYTFTVTPQMRALRFLILGTDGGTYYASEPALTKDNAEFIAALANSDDAGMLLDLVLDVSLNGRAKKQNATLFALAALCASTNTKVRLAALAQIPAVCRTTDMFFGFVGYVEQFRGHGKGLNKALLRWYTEPPAEQVAYQTTKYRTRRGWTHRDILRLTKNVGGRVTVPDTHRALFSWLVDKPADPSGLPDIVIGFEAAQVATTPATWVNLIDSYHLAWEHLPDAALNEPAVLEALEPHMGLTALIRQLPRFTRAGVIAPMSQGTKRIVERLADVEALRRARVHPLAILVAQVSYAAGAAIKGNTTWTPVPAIVDALDDAFYASFANLSPANKRTLVACDVSGSMWGGTVGGTPLTPIQAEMGLAMCLVRSEPEVFTMGFSTEFIPLTLSPKTRLDDAVKSVYRMPFGRTDCALPMEWALNQKVAVDSFAILTDNETWAGGTHPHQALRQYRQGMGIPARLAVVGLTATNFTIADPDDAGTMDLVGFDAGGADILTSFSRGDL